MIQDATWASDELLYLGTMIIVPRMIMGANSSAAVLRMALPTRSVTTESKGVAVLMVK